VLDNKNKCLGEKQKEIAGNAGTKEVDKTVGKLLSNQLRFGSQSSFHCFHLLLYQTPNYITV